MNDEHLIGFIEGLVAKPLWVGGASVEEDLAGKFAISFFGGVSDVVYGVLILG